MTGPRSELSVRVPPVVRGRANVLDAQDWSFPGPPTVVGVVGNNGVGKSSLLLAMAALLEGIPQSDVYLRDRHLTSRAFLPQHPSLPPWLTADEYARAFGFTISGLEIHAPGLMLSELRGSWIGQLSEGQVQALALAVTLRIQADLTLLDEPLSALDLRRRKGFRDFLTRWKREASGSRLTLLSTQSVTDIVGLCDAVVVLHEGTCRYAGPVAGLLENGPDRLTPASGRQSHSHPGYGDGPWAVRNDPQAFQAAIRDAVVELLG